MKNLFFTAFFLSFLFINSQDFKTVDSIVDRYPNKFNSIVEFANKVSSDFSTDIDKTRAVYYWISNHVFYDYYTKKHRINPYKTFRYKPGINYDEQLRNLKYNYALSCLKKKKAICGGYALILKFTLEHLGIKCEVISGFVKTHYREIGNILSESNHAWNAVFINNKWYLLDATWSTGNDEDEPGKFEFDDFYFLTKPELMILTHYPEDSQWLLLEKPMSKSAFFYAPVFYDNYHQSGLALTKMNGLIKSNHQITLTFNSIDETSTYTYYIKGSKSKYSQPLKIIKNGNKYVANIPFRKGRKTGLTIYANRKACMTFKIY